jgi:acetyl-CoA acetyltransferase
MIEELKKVIRDFFTERDNATYCPVRVGGGLIAAGYHLGAFAGMVLGQIHLDMNTLGTYTQHMLSLLAVGGVTAGAKSTLKGDAQ